MRDYLFVGLAAALLAATPAAASDKIDPRCAEYGEGFFYSEGTGFCIKISGHVQVDMTVGSNGAKTSTDPAFSLDARTQTDFGQMRVVVGSEKLK